MDNNNPHNHNLFERLFRPNRGPPGPLIQRNRQGQQLRRPRRRPDIPGDTPQEQRYYRAIRMRCIYRRPIGTYLPGSFAFRHVFICRCCNVIILSPYRWGGNRKTCHADTMMHQINFYAYAEEHNIDYPPLRAARQQLFEEVFGPLAPPTPPVPANAQRDEEIRPQPDLENQELQDQP